MIVKIFLSEWELSVVTRESELVTSFHQNSSATGFKTWPGWPWYFRSQIYFGSELQYDWLLSWFLVCTLIITTLFIHHCFLIILRRRFFAGNVFIFGWGVLDIVSQVRISLQQFSHHTLNIKNQGLRSGIRHHEVLSLHVAPTREHGHCKKCVFMETFAIFSMYSFTNWEE